MFYDLSDINTIKALLKKHGFQFSKALGQNFIVDGSVCPDMAEALCADRKTAVLEIGPGIGVLTKELCQRAGKVVSIELDRKLFPILEETLADCRNFTLVEGDFLKLDLKALFEKEFKGFEKIKVCANLPYYITSPVIMTLLEGGLPVGEIVVMVQKEAAQRLCAKPGDKECGAVSAAICYYGVAETLFEVGRECFMPSPKVDSAVIRITPHAEREYDIKDEKAFFTLVKAAFSQRRKTAVNSVSSMLGIPKSKIIAALEALGLDVNIRAEKLTMEDFAGLSDILM